MAARTQRLTLDRLLDMGTVKGLGKFYASAQAELVRKIDKALKGGKKDTMTVQQMQVMLAQVKDAQAYIAKRLAAGMVPATVQAQTEGIQQAAKTIVDLEKMFTGATIALPVEEAATFMGLIQSRQPSLIKANAASFARYGTTVTQKIQQQLALSLASGETPFEAMSRVEKTANIQFWQAERIVRTELAYAFNAGHVDSTASAAKELGDDLYNRWCEHVDDFTGTALDDRVANDSLVLHGQVVLPGQPFVMPADPRVPAKLWGKTFMQGPNRPNDRSVTMPWRPHWGIPAWRMVNGKRTQMKLEKRTLADLKAKAAKIVASAK
jgi:hypothetical protein